MTRLTVKMADGSTYEAELLRASERLVRRFPRLAPFRFFDLFFPESAEPVLVSAYGRGGVLLKRERGPSAGRHHAASWATVGSISIVRPPPSGSAPSRHGPLRQAGTSGPCLSAHPPPGSSDRGARNGARRST